MSKGLEALEKLYPKTTYMPYYTRSERRAFCKIIEKELKALEIIREKLINVEHFVYFATETSLKEEDRFDLASGCGSKPLTKVEYDLLKEVLL